METHVYEATIRKKGFLELRNLPFEKGDEIRIVISAKGKKAKFEALLNNHHGWTEGDIKAVLKGRDIINQWKIS